MKTFEVLSRATDVHQSHLLEASAGTGKTFSIENIVVRLLIEKKPLELQQILVVTFTKAATRDLKARIRQSIEKALDFFNAPAFHDHDHFLSAIQSQGEEAVKQAKKRLEQALFCFDNAQIFTLHSFCTRSLKDHLFEGDLSPALSIESNRLNTTKMK